MKNLVFITGPQGAGKSTLLKKLKGSSVLVPELTTSVVSMMHTTPRERRSLKIAQRALENFEYLQVARANSDKIVLGDRCIYCIYAFGETYARCGWITECEKNEYNFLAPRIFPQDVREPPAIVLNPGFDVVWRHLHGRWEIEGKKWREDDVEYIKHACASYESFRHHPKILYIDHAINFVNNKDVNYIYAWLEKITGISCEFPDKSLSCLAVSH